MLRRVLVAIQVAFLTLPSIPAPACGADPPGPAPGPGCERERVVEAGPIAVTISERGEVVEVGMVEGAELSVCGNSGVEPKPV